MANRVGWKCSNPNCIKATRGAGVEKTDVINIGVAAHITAASEGGLRYDENMTAQESLLKMEYGYVNLALSQ